MSKFLNDNFDLKDGGYSNYEDTTTLPRHRWYYYKEGFSPNLVEKAIEQTGVTKNDLILDPFNGSGTTTLSSSILGYKSLGIEVNPFTSFLADSKIRNADSNDLTKWYQKIARSIDKGNNNIVSPLLGYSTFSYSKRVDKWLFNRPILNSFELGWTLTDNIGSYNVKKLVRLALISAAMQNCNATRDGKCLRYRDSWKENKFNKDSFLFSLEQNIKDIVADVENQPLNATAKVLKGDCRTLLNSPEIGNFKLCITSPPYLNTFDYTDIYRPELFLGKFIEGSQQLYNLRLTTVRSHVQAKWKEPSMSDFGLLFQQTLKHVKDNAENLMHPQIPSMIQAYFEDMFYILKSLRNKASNGGQVWFVVSNSAYANMEVPVDLIIGDIGAKAGWYLKEIGVLRYIKKRKTKYSPDVDTLRESVIIFSRNKK